MLISGCDQIVLIYEYSKVAESAEMTLLFDKKMAWFLEKRSRTSARAVCNKGRQTF